MSNRQAGFYKKSVPRQEGHEEEEKGGRYAQKGEEGKRERREEEGEEGREREGKEEREEGEMGKRWRAASGGRKEEREGQPRHGSGGGKEGGEGYGKRAGKGRKVADEDVKPGSSARCFVFGSIRVAHGRSGLIGPVLMEICVLLWACALGVAAVEFLFFPSAPIAKPCARLFFFFRLFKVA